MRYIVTLLVCFMLPGSLTNCKTVPKTKAGSSASADNSRNALDWSGTYQGTLPCADCEGIATIVSLKKDRTYSLKRRYVGKETAYRQSTGTFTWDGEGRRITLSGGEPTTYLVGENKLIQLDKAGERITGNLADRYELIKTPPGLTGKYWKLVEVMGEQVQPKVGLGKEAHIVLKEETNRVQGNGGCNNLMGGYELGANNRIRFTQMASTMMACPDMTTEQKFAKALETADGYLLKGDTLILNRARMAPLARFVAVYKR